jgi:hypothetical protein
VVANEHWKRWHESYDDPGSSLSRRLAVVRRRLSEALTGAPAGPIRLVSMCAGQGRDVIPVLVGHPRGRDVTARLVEINADLVATARGMAEGYELAGLEIIEGDASTTTVYAGAVPADIVMVCGVFGNVTDDDIRQTIFEVPHLSAPGATVIWTRHRRTPDRTPTIRSWFTEAGFEELAFDTVDSGDHAVGTNRLTRRPESFRPNRRMFSFLAVEAAPDS